MMYVVCFCVSDFLFFFKQKTAYEMRISDWSSDVCSSDLLDQLVVLDEVQGLLQRVLDRRAELDRVVLARGAHVGQRLGLDDVDGEVVVLRVDADQQIGRASCRERVCQYV